jgi:hypothetical protein
VCICVCVCVRACDCVGQTYTIVAGQVWRQKEHTKHTLTRRFDAVACVYHCTHQEGAAPGLPLGAVIDPIEWANEEEPAIIMSYATSTAGGCGLTYTWALTHELQRIGLTVFHGRMVRLYVCLYFLYECLGVCSLTWCRARNSSFGFYVYA